jgi:hypothetical protein
LAFWSGEKRFVGAPGKDAMANALQPPAIDRPCGSNRKRFRLLFQAAAAVLLETTKIVLSMIGSSARRAVSMLAPGQRIRFITHMIHITAG